MPSIKTLLCPVDFSQMSKAVLDYAVFMAQSHDARLKLVHVVDQLHGFDSYKILHMTAVEITHEMERQAEPSSRSWWLPCRFLQRLTSVLAARPMRLSFRPMMMRRISS